MKKKTVIKNNWRVYPEHKKKVIKLAKERKCSQSSVLRDMIDFCH